VITIEVTPLNPIPNGLNWQDAMVYANRSLDGNAINNIITQTMYVTPCP